MASLLGIDVGTTGCKVVAVDHQGIQHRSHEEYPLTTPETGAAELDTDRVWQALRETIRQVTRKCNKAPETLCVSTLGEAVTAVGRDRKPLAPTVVSLDKRPNIYYEELLQRISKEDICQITGLEPLPHYSIFKWMWIMNNRPEIYNKSWKLLCYGELIAVRLGLEPLIDYSMASRTLALDRESMSWSPQILEAAEIDVEKLPEVVAPGTCVGRISNGMSDDLGLAQNSMLMAGGLDQACAAVGAGLEIDGKSLLSLGTTGVLAEVLPSGREHAGVIPVIPHLRESTNIAIAGTPAGGALLRWFRDVCVTTGNSEVNIGRPPTYSEIVDSAKDCSTDLIVIPHLGGSRAAFNNPDTSGAIVGLTFATDRGELVRGILEAVAFEIEYMARRMREDGFRISELVAVGGGSRSKFWLQIMADVLNVPILSTESADAAAVGAAVLAGEKRGVEFDPGLLMIRDRFDPNRDRLELYTAKLERFRSIYQSLLV